MRQVSVEQVARRAGVAKSTVSFVLNNKGNVSPQTREKVLATIKELGYTRENKRPASPVKKEAAEKNVVAYINPKIRHTEAASEYIAGLRQCAREKDFSLTLAITSSLSEAENQFQFLEEAARPSGVVMIGVDPDDSLIFRMLELKVPSVVVNRVVKHPDISYVSIDHDEAGREAAQYLLGLGHRHFLFIVEPAYNQSEVARFNGFVKGLEESGEEIKLALVKPFSAGEGEVSQGKVGLGDLVRTGRIPLIESEKLKALTRTKVIQFSRELDEAFSPTCLVAASDALALKGLAALQGLGVNVPQEVSVMGFNNKTTGLEANPALTTVDENWQQQGYTAARILMELAEHKERRSEKILLRHRLIERGSTARIS